jgi:plastocyanin
LGFPEGGRLKSWIRTAVLLGAILALVGVGCGGDDDSGGEPADTAAQQAPTETGGAEVSEVKMSEYKFDPSDVSAKAGDTLTVDNGGSLQHDLRLRKGGKELGGTKLVDAGGSTKLKVDFRAGSYEMFCSVPGHEDLGMKGTFTVK